MNDFIAKPIIAAELDKILAKVSNADSQQAKLEYTNRKPPSLNRLGGFSLGLM